MKFISSLRAEKSIAQFLEAENVDAPAARKAAESLKKIGDKAIPQVIDALAAADREQTTVLVETLTNHLNDNTFRQFAAGLGHADQRCVTGVAWALSSANNYKANQLVELLGDDGVSKPAVIDVLRSKKGRLNVSQLLRRAYDLEPAEKAALFKIIAEVADDATVPDLLARMDGKDPAIRVHLIDVLSKFSRPDVARAMEAQLSDSHKAVRQSALIALHNMPGDRDIAKISSLLTDVDMEVQNRAVDLLVHVKSPETMKHLVTVLKDENEYARRSAVEVLNEIADPSTVRDLLNTWMTTTGGYGRARPMPWRRSAGPKS